MDESYFASGATPSLARCDRCGLAAALIPHQSGCLSLVLGETSTSLLARRHRLNPSPIQSIQVIVPGGNVILALAGGKLRMWLLGQRSNRCIL